MKSIFQSLKFLFAIIAYSVCFQSINASQPDVKQREEPINSAASENEKQKLLADLNLIITDMKHYFILNQNEKPYIELLQTAINNSFPAIDTSELKDATCYLDAIQENMDYLELNKLKSLYNDFDPIAKLFLNAPNRFVSEETTF